MPLRAVAYQMKLRVKSLVPCFHKRHVENLALMVTGIVASESVSLPKVARHTPVGRIQIESRVERFERLLQCAAFAALEVLAPIATLLLRRAARRGEPLLILMDRSIICDRLNLLHVALAYGSRALPLGWVRVPHEGASDLALQKQLLGWLAGCLPEGAEAWIVADREFHSPALAQYITKQLGLHCVLRIKAGTLVEVCGRWRRAGSLAVRGAGLVTPLVPISRTRHCGERFHLVTHWERDQEEPWLLMTDVGDEPRVAAIYERRYWVEEMFSDHKSRGLNLESTRITDPDRMERLMVAVAIAYLWVMEIGAHVLVNGQWRQVDNRSAQPTVSLCQLGLRWFWERLVQGGLPRCFNCNFPDLEGA